MSAEMGETDCNDIQPMLAAYALEALEPEERSRVDEHLDTCVSCRAELATYAHVVDSLGVAAPVETPRPELKASILAAATGSSVPASQVAPTEMPSKTPVAVATNKRSNIVILLSAASIVLLLGVVVMAVLLARAIDDRDEAVAAQEHLAAYLGADGHVVAMTSLDAANWDGWQGQGKLLSAPGEPTVVMIEGCPPTSDDRTYRVWVALQGDRTGVGEITVDDSGKGWMEVHSPEELANYDELGITVVTDGDQRADMMVTAL